MDVISVHGQREPIHFGTGAEKISLVLRAAQSGRMRMVWKAWSSGKTGVAYVAWLEARANNAGGEIDKEAMQAIRRGWYLGREIFKDRLLKLLEKASQTTGGA